MKPEIDHCSYKAPTTNHHIKQTKKLTNQAATSVLCSLSRELIRSLKQLVIQQ